MAHRRKKKRLTHKTIAAAKPREREYTLWDGALANFGVSVHSSGVKSFIVQARVRSRMRKFTLRRYPEVSVGKTRREAAALLSRLWRGEAMESTRMTRVSLFREFPVRSMKSSETTLLNDQFVIRCSMPFRPLRGVSLFPTAMKFL